MCHWDPWRKELSWATRQADGNNCPECFDGPVLMEKLQEHDYVAIDTETGGSSTHRSRNTSCSFQDNFDVFNSAVESGDTTRLKLLLRIYPEEEFEILSCKNCYGQTLLHLVASIS